MEYAVWDGDCGDTSVHFDVVVLEQERRRGKRTIDSALASALSVDNGKSATFQGKDAADQQGSVDHEAVALSDLLGGHEMMVAWLLEENDAASQSTTSVQDYSIDGPGY